MARSAKPAPRKAQGAKAAASAAPSIPNRERPPEPKRYEAKRDELWTLRAGQSPLNRIGTARDQALGMLYLASDASAYVNGQNLVVDGGFTAVK